MKNALILAALVSTGAQAAKIAVIDSGLDYKHPGLQGHIWINEAESDDGRDNDGNGYQDDIYGWNFANSNNQVIDYKYLGTFGPDVLKYFSVQGRMMLGTATEEDKTWYKEKIQDQKFIKELSKFGNFVHGTHVAGISVAGTQSQAMGVKLIPTEIGASLRALSNQAKTAREDGFRMRLVKTALEALATQQMTMLEEISLYVNSRGADVANGSFGTGFKQAQMITGAAFKIVFFRDATPEELELVTRHFMDTLIREGQRMVKAAPKTLFVFAAGNDGSDNDQFPTSPTNIKADNVISVAATYDVQFLANFSNFGVRNVDVAAPGMLIRSQIPGTDYLEVSGTSQAAPYVANIAGQIKDMNPALTPAQVKALIMGTVDAKEFLKGKVVSGGVVNVERAVVAARMTTSMGVNEAITRSRNSVRDQETARPVVRRDTKVAPLPLFPSFQ